MSSRTYWKNREEEQRKKNIRDEAEYAKEIEKIYANMMDEIQKEINGFYTKYAKAEGITIAEAKKRVFAGAEVIYLGWIMAGSVKGYAEAAKRYQVRAVCGVGMGQAGTQADSVRKKSSVPADIPLFTLQGNFDVKKLHGVYRLMMEIMVKTAGKALAEKKDRTPDEDDMLDMMLHGGERVKEENLGAVLDWYSAQR